MARKKNSKFWIQEAVKRPGRVKEYIKRKYGTKAFTKEGKIKTEYLKKALKEAKDKSLKAALRLALRLRGFAKKKKGRK